MGFNECYMYIKLQENQSTLNKKKMPNIFSGIMTPGAYTGGGRLKRSQLNKFLVREGAVRGVPAALYGKIVDVTKGF